MSFTTIKVGDKVFEKASKEVGTVTAIQDEHVTMDTLDNRSIYTHLSKVIKVDHVKELSNEIQENDKWFEFVKEFHEAFNHPVAKKPAPLSLERATSRQIWAGEELIELLEVTSDSKEEFLDSYNTLLQGLEKAKEKSLNAFKENKTEVDKLVGQADAVIDTLYFLIGNLVEMGIKPHNLFEIVQRANMSKLFTSEDGTKYAKYREEDGKILKSPEFFEPEPLLKEEILRQIDESK